MKKFTAFILVFCMLAAALVTGLAVFAADAGTESGETKTLDPVKDHDNNPYAYIQVKETETGATYDTRVVIVASEKTMNESNSASIHVSFITEDGKEKSKDISVTGIYRSVKANGDTYTASEGDVLFGVVVTGVPYGTKSVSASMTTKTGEISNTVDFGKSDQMPKVYTVSELNKVPEFTSLQEGAYTEKKFVAKGVVKSIGSKKTSGGTEFYQNVYITDDLENSTEDNTFYIYSLNFVGGVAPLLRVGDTITVKGYIQNYKNQDGTNTIEFSGKNGDYPLCINMVVGEHGDPTGGVFEEVTKGEDIQEGYYVFGYKKDGIVCAVMDSTNMGKSNAKEVRFYGNNIYFEDAGQYWVYLEKCEGGFAIRLPSGAYLQSVGDSGGSFATSDTVVAHTFGWNNDAEHTVKIDDGSSHKAKYLMYNSQSPRFLYYAGKIDSPTNGTQTDITLFKLNKDATYNMHTVTFMNEGKEYAKQNVLDGQKAIEPEEAPKKAGCTFEGWFTEDGDSAFSFDTAITENLTLYARFSEITEPATQEFKKVTDLKDLTDGQYLIVCESENVVFVPSKGDKAPNNDAVTIDGTTIAYSDEIATYVVTIKKYDNGYTIEISDGAYLKDKGAKTNGFETTDTEVIMTITFSNSNAADSNWKDGDVLITTSNGNVFRYNNSTNENRFRFYKSGTYNGQKSVSLYKLVDKAN